MSSLQITIPIKEHLINYLKSQNLTEPLSLNAKTPLGLFLLNLLEYSDKPPKPTKNEPTVIIEIPNRSICIDARNQFVFIPDHKAKQFSNLIEHIMFKELFGQLDLLRETGQCQKKGGKLKQQVLHFISLYGDHSNALNYDRLIKAYQRYRKRHRTLTKPIM